ncbi:GntR family transcriptional regulator [Embleya sp. NPDC020886]|uniref:GntR family transcriptional regulator n=1 Tax=Embleya sp. NPDC020886 TaxID=3363980 RepID=UPI00378ED88F
MEPARYHEITDFLRDRIMDGTLPAGQRLPSEEELAKEFGVSRPTVRQGITELRVAGLVEVLMGRGMFVRSPHARPNTTRPRGVRRDRGGRYVEADAIRRTTRDEPTATRTGARLALVDVLPVPPGDPMFTDDEWQTAEHGRLCRVRRTYVPFSVLENTPYSDTAPRLGHGLHWSENVRSRMPLPDEATSLHLADGAPLVHVLRLTSDQHERPLVLAEFGISGDDLEISCGFGRSS